MKLFNCGTSAFEFFSTNTMNSYYLQQLIPCFFLLKRCKCFKPGHYLFLLSIIMMRNIYLPNAMSTVENVLADPNTMKTMENISHGQSPGSTRIQSTIRKIVLDSNKFIC